MPVVFRSRGIKFHFFSNEGTPREPIHIHAERQDADAKFWLYPLVSVAKNFGYNRRELAELIFLIESRRDDIRRAWDAHFRD